MAKKKKVKKEKVLFVLPSGEEKEIKIPVGAILKTQYEAQESAKEQAQTQAEQQAYSGQKADTEKKQWLMVGGGALALLLVVAVAKRRR